MSNSPARRGLNLGDGIGKFTSLLKAGQDLFKSDDAFAAECGRVVRESSPDQGTRDRTPPPPSKQQPSRHQRVPSHGAEDFSHTPLHAPAPESRAPPVFRPSPLPSATERPMMDRPEAQRPNGAAAHEDASTSGADTTPSGAAREGLPKLRAMSEHKIRKFAKILAENVVDIDALREIAWGGIPADLRPDVWRLLLGYLPPAKARQATSLARKRAEYTEMVPRYYDISNSERSEEELGALRQVAVDVPRTAPGMGLFHQEALQISLNRMLYIWGIRHPASGYVQGMNDLVTPFLAVFLSEHLSGPMDTWVVDRLPQAVLLEVEADCYWCLCKLIECIQDHYTYAQPGIQRTVFKVKELVRRVNEPVAAHLEAQSLDFLQFSFRWVNCLLIREIPFAHSIRLWDTYMSEGAHFSELLVYICASFLLTWSDKICQMEFQDLIIFLQKLPTADWDEGRIDEMLGKAHMWRTCFGDAQSHLR